jgi:uncharacterized membrane-anchored protein YhcB (DUF1043 family)
MKIHLTTIELWFWRVSIIGLIIYAVILGMGVNQAQNMGVKNIDLIKTNTEDINDILVNQLEDSQTRIAQTYILQAMAEDYPPKMKIGEREWCLNRVCLKGLGIDE